MRVRTVYWSAISCHSAAQVGNRSGCVSSVWVGASNAAQRARIAAPCAILACRSTGRTCWMIVPPVCWGPKRLETSWPLSHKGDMQKWYFLGLTHDGYYINPELLVN